MQRCKSDHNSKPSDYRYGETLLTQTKPDLTLYFKQVKDRNNPNTISMQQDGALD
jgi:hypothetical protein